MKTKIRLDAAFKGVQLPPDIDEDSEEAAAPVKLDPRMEEAMRASMERTFKEKQERLKNRG